MTSPSQQPAADGAINLLEKYTTLNRSMDDARHENARIQAEKESILQQVEKLGLERTEMERSIEQARQETVALNENVHDALNKYATLQDAHAKALLHKMEARRQLEFAKQTIKEQRLDFLGASRDFRTTCKRLRLSASAVGDDMATCKAFVETRSANDWNSSDLVEYDDAQDDTELEQALAEHARRKQERDEAKQALEKAQEREKSSLHEATRRLECKKNSIAQLERLRAANADAENQLKDLDEQTREARELAHHYEKDVDRIMSNNARQLGRPPSSLLASAPPSVTPSTVTIPRSQQQQQQQSRPHNPYASSRSASNSSTSRTTAPRRQQQQTSRSWNSSEAQPHLMTRRGRRPFDRQFGSNALDIISGRETLEENDVPRSEPMVYKPLQNSSSNRLLLDSDSEDDEELFGDSVFSKKK